MSSLQKFHRRTNNAVVNIFPTVGSGSDNIGYWLAGTTGNKLIIAPKSTEVQLEWGSYGITRGAVNTTNGLPNTNTLYAFGSAAHPAAYWCKTLATGGYTTWYYPAKEELISLVSNRGATPFYPNNALLGKYYLSSTEATANRAVGGYISPNPLGFQDLVGSYNKSALKYVRAVRRSAI